MKVSAKRRFQRWAQTIGKGVVLGVVLMVAAGRAELVRAQISIDITRGRVEPIPIAVPVFVATGGGSIARDVADVLSADLERSGLFRPLDRSAFLQKIPNLDVQPSFADWRAINAQALVQGEVGLEADGRYRISFRLWDVFLGQEMLGLAYVTQGENWRRVAHMIADGIYERLTGESGYFDSRVVYVAEAGNPLERRKRLAIMDQDGANHRFLTDGAAMALTPRFSPTAQEVTYMSYAGQMPRILIFNIDTGRQEVLGDFPGMTFAPRFSPDGSRVVFSMAREGNSDVYEMDLRTRRTVRLTEHPAIDTSPAYSPDGSWIVFNSDRGGNQQLYVMTADGANPQRISFGEGRYATPVWSPRGDLIAFTKMKDGLFYIGVMQPDGGGERMLSSGFVVEGPTWSPNGRILMYYRQEANGAAPQLYSIDLTGENERRILTPVGGSDPAWSQVLP